MAVYKMQNMQEFLSMTVNKNGQEMFMPIAVYRMYKRGTLQSAMRRGGGC